MVRLILAMPAAPQPADAADALALAVCHLWRDGGATAGGTAPVTAGGTAPVTAAQRQWLAALEHARSAARRAPGVGAGR